MVDKLLKRGLDSTAATRRDVAPAKPPKAPSRARATTVTASSEPAPLGIFAALEKARANMLEGDANLARARKILG